MPAPSSHRIASQHQEEDDGGESGRAVGGGGAGLRSEARAGQKGILRRGPAALQRRRKDIAEGRGGGLVVVERISSHVKGGSVESIKGGGEGEGASKRKVSERRKLRPSEGEQGIDQSERAAPVGAR